MSKGTRPGLNLINLFKQEAHNHTDALTKALLEWETNPQSLSCIEILMRSAHSLKGAAKIIGLDLYGQLAHSLEDCFLAAQKKKITLTIDDFDILLEAVDALVEINQLDENDMLDWPSAQKAKIHSLNKKILNLINNHKKSTSPPQEPISSSPHTNNEIFKIFSHQASTQIDKIITTLNGALNRKLKPKETENIKNALASIHANAKITEIQKLIELINKIENNWEAFQQDTLKEEIVKTFINQLSNLKNFSTDNLPPPENEKNLALKPTPEPQTQEEKKLDSQEPSLRKEKEELAKNVAADLSHLMALKENSNDDIINKEEQIVKISATNLNNLMALAAESLVESKRLQPVKQHMLQLKSLYQELTHIFYSLEKNYAKDQSSLNFAIINKYVNENTKKYRKTLQGQVDAFEHFLRNNSVLSSKLYNEVLQSRMRPFHEGVHSFPRIVRNLSRSLGKLIQLEIAGLATPVDRDILEKLESPLGHILRNACDHGIEIPEARKALGKPEKGTIKISAHHNGGMLLLTVSDDGQGIDPETIRTKILKQKLLTQEMASTLSKDELLDFLFLPGFSTAKKVTDISGRGVGLDVVRNLMQAIGGKIHVDSTVNKGTNFYLHLPVTRSVLRALLVQIDNEPYAFPLSRINKTLQIHKNQVRTLEKHAYFNLEGENIALISSHEVLGFPLNNTKLETFSVVVLGEKNNTYSLVVDKLLGETELVVRPLDTRLGKVPCISAASINEEGLPVLILDVDDLMKSIEKLLAGKDHSDTFAQKNINHKKNKSILVVDDSITVRETQRQILENEGYLVTTAVDGADGWNTLRSKKFDLVITDIDMPRMNGFELIKHIKSEEKNIPIIIISYKDRKEDHKKGLEIGADYYLTKSSFRDQTFINAVKELIGSPQNK